jgi:hypothetical protein
MKSLLVGLLLLSPAVMAVQTCYTGVTETTPATRFTVSVDGTVSDSVTGLMWQTCSYGQGYDVATNSCINSAVKVNWQEALRAAVNDRTGAYTDWQVPNNKELASILEHSCVTPSINQSVIKVKTIGQILQVLPIKLQLGYTPLTEALTVCTIKPHLCTYV